MLIRGSEYDLSYVSNPNFRDNNVRLFGWHWPIYWNGKWDDPDKKKEFYLLLISASNKVSFMAATRYPYANFTNRRMVLFHIPQCSIQNRNVHISVLNGALLDTEQVHSGICKLGQWYKTRTLYAVSVNKIMNIIIRSLGSAWWLLVAWRLWCQGIS